MLPSRIRALPVVGKSEGETFLHSFAESLRPFHKRFSDHLPLPQDLLASLSHSMPFLEVTAALAIVSRWSSNGAPIKGAAGALLLRFSFRRCSDPLLSQCNPPLYLLVSVSVARAREQPRNIWPAYLRWHAAVPPELPLERYIGLGRISLPVRSFPNPRKGSVSLTLYPPWRERN